MPSINLCFQGYINGVEVTKATNADGESVDVSEMSEGELCRKLNAGELFVSLGDLLYEGDDEEIELHDFAPGI